MKRTPWIDFIPRRFLRFRLRTLLIAFTILAVFLALWVGPATRQRRGVDLIELAGGQIGYEGQPLANMSSLRYRGPTIPSTLPSEPWLYRILGKHYFEKATHVEHRSPAIGPTIRNQAVADDELMAAIVSLPHLEYVRLHNPKISEKGFELIPGRPKLRTLEIYYDSPANSQLQNPDLSGLGQLTNLYELSLSELPSMGGQFAFLNRLTQLESLTLRGANLTQFDLQAIGDCTKLRVLDLSHCWLPVQEVGFLGKLVLLECLKLSSVQIDDKSIKLLSSLRKLKELHVYAANHSPDQQDNLQAALGNCKLVMRP